MQEHHHKDISGGAARAAVFGFSDGLVTNIALILGVTAASLSFTSITIAGLAGLVAGAISMATGEYISMTAQKELLEKELAKEKYELIYNTQQEIDELAEIYVEKGLPPELAQRVSEILTSNLNSALDVHAKEELGIDPNSLGNPYQAAFSSFITFALGAFLPLAPWFFTSSKEVALPVSIVLASLAALTAGAILGKNTEKSTLKSALRQVLVTVLASAVTVAIGLLFGVTAP